MYAVILNFLKLFLPIETFAQSIFSQFICLRVQYFYQTFSVPKVFFI